MATFSERSISDLPSIRGMALAMEKQTNGFGQQAVET